MSATRIRKRALAGLPLQWQALREMSFRKSSISSDEFHDGQHRFEHWYRDNSVYFLTSRCRGKTHAFASEEAKDEGRSVQAVRWIVARSLATEVASPA
jgi:hypothetical protein